MALPRLSARAPRNLAQTLFLASALGFTLFLALSIVLRSQGRRSIITANAAFEAEDPIFMDPTPREASGRLHLEDFHRVEVKNGRPVWEIRARDAKYYAAESVTHVNDAYVRIYRSETSSVRIQAKAARLYLRAQSIVKAELEGDVSVEFDESLRIRTGSAIYDAEMREIHAPGEAHIDGSGFKVEGVGLELRIDSQIVKLRERVYSLFEPNAEIPKSVPLPQSAG